MCALRKQTAIKPGRAPFISSSKQIQSIPLHHLRGILSGVSIVSGFWSRSERDDRRRRYFDGGGLFFQKETATRFRFVPYRVGLGAAMQDLVAGQIDFMIDTAANSLPQVSTGTIKAFAVTGRQRLARAPDIPTVGEEGLPGLHALNWQAVFLPNGVPTEVIAKLNSAVVAALADASVRRQLADIGQEIFPREQQTPEALRSFQRAEIQKWWPLIAVNKRRIEEP